MKSILPMDRLGRTRPLALATAVAAVLAACGGAPAPASSSGQEAHAGTVALFSSQAPPGDRAGAKRPGLLAALHRAADLGNSRSDAQIVQQVQAEEQAGKVTVDLIGGLHGDFPQLAQAGQLQDLTPLLQKLEQDRHFNPDLLKYGKLGSGKQYYIPWLQATYMM